MQVFIMNYSLNLFFLLLVPLLCEGVTVQMTMPSHSAINSEIRVKCDFTADQHLTHMILLNGDTETVATYIINEGIFKLPTPGRISLEVSSGTTVTGGSLNFVISQLTCSDFTWYVCRGIGTYETVDSRNITLQVLPAADSIMKTTLSDLAVNQISTFMCRGTISKEGPFSVRWYRKTITYSNQLVVGQAEVLGQDQCSRLVSSHLTYYVSETDRPSLILWCQIESGRIINQMGKFPIQGTTDVKMTMPSNKAKGSEMKVKCDFKVETGTNEQVISMALLRGDSEPAIAEYVISKNAFSLISPSNGMKLENGPGTTVTGGSLTFVINRLACSDFTWYVCRARVPTGTVDSQNKTLLVKPQVDSIVPMSIRDYTATFMCRGTIGKEGTFSVQWYKATCMSPNQLAAEQATVTDQNQCSRSVSSTIHYDVGMSDTSGLILCCRIEGGGHTIDEIAVFTVPGAGCTLKENAIMVLMVSFIACTFHPF